MNYYDVESYTARQSIGYLMRHGASLMRDQLEKAFAGHGFTFVQWITLMLLRENPSVTPGDLCRDLQHDSGAFTRVLDQLERRDLLRRRRSATDRRVVQLQLRPAGRKVVAALLPTLVQHLNIALQGFTKEEVETLAALLERLITRLEQSAADAADPAANTAEKR